jgi:hypothetical protein
LSAPTGYVADQQGAHAQDHGSTAHVQCTTISVGDVALEQALIELSATTGDENGAAMADDLVSNKLCIARFDPSTREQQGPAIDPGAAATLQSAVYQPKQA